jgi:hypothetical protein
MEKQIALVTGGRLCTLVSAIGVRTQCQPALRKVRGCWTRNLIKRRAMIRRDRASAVHFAAGHRAKKVCGIAAAATPGIRAIPAEFVPPAFTSGLQRSAFRALAGRCIQIGMRSNCSCVGALKVRVLVHRRAGTIAITLHGYAFNDCHSDAERSEGRRNLLSSG